MSGEAADKHYVWYGNFDKTRWQNALDAGLEFLRANKENNEYYKLVNTGNPREDFISAYFDRYNGEVLTMYGEMLSTNSFMVWVAPPPTMRICSKWPTELLSTGMISL